MGFWSPVGWGHGRAVRPDLACLHPAWCPGPSLTKFRLLQKHLGKGPANATNERGPQHQGKALHVELRGLVGEHEEAPGDKEDHQDQSCTLLEWGAVATNLGVLRSSNLEFGGQQPSWLPLFSPPPRGGSGQLLPIRVCRADIQLPRTQHSLPDLKH